MNKRVLIEVFLREYHMGEERAVHSKDLEALFFISGRALRRCIKQLREEEIPICSSKNGYYYAKDQAEIKKSARLDRNDVKQFSKLETFGMPIGTGGLLSLYPEVTHVSERVVTIPAQCI